MNKVIPLTKNHKDYEDVPDGLKWAIPIHECLENPEVKERSRRLEEESKKRVKKEMASLPNRSSAKIMKTIRRIK